MATAIQQAVTAEVATPPAATASLWRPYTLDAATRARIEQVLPAIADADRRAEGDRRFPQDAIEAMLDAGLFNLALPRAVGGDERHPVAEMEIYELVARTSVAAAWNLLVGNIHTAWAAAYLSDDAVATLFPAGHRTVVAGQAAPTGKGRRVDGGYRVTGRYSWGSGISHASWVLGGFTDSATGDALIFVVPKAAVKVLDNWNVIGIEGSGSYDYTADDIFVAESYVFPFLCTVPKRGGARFTLPWTAQASVPHSAVPLGGAEHAFEAITRLAAGKRRSSQPGNSVAERGAFQRDLADAYIRLNAMRDNAAALFTHMIDRAEAGIAQTASETAELSAMAAFACRLSVDVANFAFRYGGGNSVRLDSPIQRALRDVLVAQQHVAVADTSFEALGSALIDRMAPAA